MVNKIKQICLAYITLSTDMQLLTVLLIALALAVDAFAVALAAGVNLCAATFRQTFRLAWHFGFFQGGMTLIGWMVGLSVKKFMEGIDHWIAFFLLAYVGIKMIIEACKDSEAKSKTDPTRGKTLVLLSFATSIDALAVGISLAVMSISIWFPAFIIALVAAALTAIGLHLGCFLGSANKIGSRAEIAGGLVLLAIGLKILHEHGVF